MGGVPGGEDAMRSLGFTEAEGSSEEGSWLLSPSAAAWDVLTSGRAEIQQSLNALPAPSNTSAASSTAAVSGSTAGFAGGLGVLPTPGSYPTTRGLPGASGMGGMNMDAVQRMMQDPAAMQGMMNDPSVQAMVRSNPQMATAVQVGVISRVRAVA